MNKISKRERGRLGLSIVVPCYNEEESVKRFYNTIIKVLGVEHSSLGMQCNRFAKFRIVADSSLASPSKFSKNSKSTTANIRMLGGDNAVESLDSKLSQKMKTDKNAHRGGAASHI